jgi:glycerol-3-phosphate dehydrogenase
VRSVWVGLRPLVKPASDDNSKSTKTISREHTVAVSRSGMVTVTGGKWTTYRAMAEDVLDKCQERGLLPKLPKPSTAAHQLVGAPVHNAKVTSLTSLSNPPGAHLYGTDAALLTSLPGAGHELAPHLTEAMVRFAVRYEYARTVEDVLARRNRMLFLDAKAAAAAAPAVAAVMAEELGAASPNLAALALDDFLTLAAQYATLPG